MKFAQNIHPIRLFDPTRLIGTWEYFVSKTVLAHCSFLTACEKKCFSDQERKKNQFIRTIKGRNFFLVKKVSFKFYVLEIMLNIK